jgi:hypothetical protein
MRRSFASVFVWRTMPAAALLLVPLVTNAAASNPVPAPSSGSNAVSAPAIELPEGAATDAGACAQSDEACPVDSPIGKDRAYLVETAHPGDTMMRQGPDVAIGRLNPEFATRLADAIREARESGLPEAGIFSAYRPPAFGVGGFRDKFNSLHAYGLAVDMQGIGAPGSSEAKLWHKIAAKHGVVCPYGVNNRAEWNHCQPTRIKVIRADNPLRKTIRAEGPPSPGSMFDAGKALIESVANLFSAFIGAPATAEQQRRTVAYTQRNRRLHTADASASRQHRQARINGRKEQGSRSAKATRTAAASGGVRTDKHAAKHRSAAVVRRGQRAT